MLEVALPRIMRGSQNQAGGSAAVPKIRAETRGRLRGPIPKGAVASGCCSPEQRSSNLSVCSLVTPFSVWNRALPPSSKP